MYDVIGAGIGPFNLGLAALLEDIPGTDALFFDKKKEFAWHPGLLIKGTDLQVAFLADLVTLADPKSRYTFLNFLHEHDRLYRFYTFNEFDIPRREFNDYLSWAASEIKSCRFGSEVIGVKNAGGHYDVSVKNIEDGSISVYQTKHFVMGTGSEPLIPAEIAGEARQDTMVSTEYLFRKDELAGAESITVVGSGQSAAEIFSDLLHDEQYRRSRLQWVTRSAGFRELETAKLGQEMFTPDYVEYFNRLPFKERLNTLPELDGLRHGIDSDTLAAIYDALYHRSISGGSPDVYIQPMAELEKIEKQNGRCVLSFHQWQMDETFTADSEKVILATGFKPHIPEWFTAIAPDIEWEDEKRFKVTADSRLVFKDDRRHHFFTLTNLDHAHGTGATNLKLSVYRNQKIINTILGKEHFSINKKTAFQQFLPAQKN
ncbi:SidA/IucD/PvdA family monooxygenase [Bacillus velezensis]|uniref:lysine N(6)-hydroxylase/L-ornithine N(5)-oxygenase family protein n=1 Tax=Bacillus TaxID=1386 RepID=UPI000396507E|nr:MULTISPECIES: SidA/IucD/PvdA family monooxygenase [Bacillus]ERH52110.1 lysine/ornithine N-monooxygenase [Bacillus amyloliquefaciens EGD-AQ14]KAF6538450.1 SidA/IucD/PvdA family monooxygenase [Bacillus sp. EKM208B]MBU0443879.1 SidA/IucD/PvdA family monooxygenase [Bacillus amyloliquefaciens]MBY0032225.1 SidA/IucD/PvdA family monooxygenase [Bacillus velezensis]MBY0041265.1 SidA/IucD/PvdA family monooxygenase [Bacillus velezensis]